MTLIKEFNVADEAQSTRLGQQLSQQLTAPFVVYLDGPLGAGKTTFSRGIIQGLGHKGAVKSPTYTLVEPYELPKLTLYHFDLYRLSDPEELEFMGIRDYFNDGSICLIEWPERGFGCIEAADLIIKIRYFEEGRQFTIEAHSDKAKGIIEKLS
ncbi:tRNA (adenosine(37)-N6)-threonylcarbamoyltransferase complex ATPase subunit type 1 TsaE [Paraferrimonas haliotis]|uniref:tRNA threonylcarbamoyladenosine biosynthesis protein TsaE n=1 Tax=Paraferrimonas haliotis TaxID=2013866 RepID=A0AA37WWC3_9GAMM|nr:tRNA (adenosine(37)-N6)-threonylcarbamoyltransferase complex ATPase subunit type 1 TsaE [Paraferrimonas haliotis]GLS83312.1 tRNA (adenosine(37)-N6)-threonylcarbamoyltransferase complex ATPase subunit type 1 TsaE [Paraferrimonas haliotis]